MHASRNCAAAAFTRAKEVTPVSGPSSMMLSKDSHSLVQASFFRDKFTHQTRNFAKSKAHHKLLNTWVKNCKPHLSPAVNFRPARSKKKIRGRSCRKLGLLGR